MDQNTTKHPEGQIAPIKQSKKCIRSAVQKIKDATDLVEGIILLRLDTCGINPQDIKILTDIMQETQHPISANLSGNFLGDEGVEEIAKAIEKTKHELLLNLGANDIGIKGIMALARATEKAKAPLTLMLQDNNIDNEGAKEIAKAIAKAKFPLELIIDSNLIEDEGAAEIADAIMKSRVCIKLEIHHNCITSNGNSLIKAALACNKAALTYNKIVAEYLANEKKYAKDADNYQDDDQDGGAEKSEDTEKQENTSQQADLSSDQVIDGGIIVFEDKTPETIELLTMPEGIINSKEHEEYTEAIREVGEKIEQNATRAEILLPTEIEFDIIPEKQHIPTLGIIELSSNMISI